MKWTSGAEFDLPLLLNLLLMELKGLTKEWFLIILFTRIRVSSLGTDLKGK